MKTFTFALPAGYDWCVKSFSKRVKTKAFVRAYKEQLHNTADRLTTANSDPVQIIGNMLQIAYGANIGRQVEALLKPADFIKIKFNIIQCVNE
jgi:hypothetical protein